MSNNQLKPTNEEIVEYIYGYVKYYFDSHYVNLDSDWVKKDLKRIGENSDFDVLRSLFAPVMYNSIEEWKENN